MDLDSAELSIRFNYHEPEDDWQIRRYEEIRKRAREFANYIASSCPPSRELSLAITKLEEVVMWANAAIARRE